MTTSIDKADLKRRMHGARRGAEARSWRACAPGRASTALLDPVQVEVYGAQHAAQPGRDGLGARAAHAVGAGVGPVQRPAGRERRSARPGSGSTRSSTAR